MTCGDETSLNMESETVTTESPTLFFNDMYGFFLSVSLTTKRNDVILLTEGKDLYETCTNNALNSSSNFDLITTAPEIVS